MENKIDEAFIPELHLIAVVLLAGQQEIVRLLKARDKILSQWGEGKLSFYTFSYPSLGSVKYDHYTIELVNKLAQVKTSKQLFQMYKDTNLISRSRIHAVVAILIKKQKQILRLYQAVEEARNNNFTAKNVNYTFTNPFEEIYPARSKSETYSGDELIFLQEKGNRLKFKDIFTMEKWNYIKI